MEAELILRGVDGLALQQLSQAEPAPLLQAPRSTVVLVPVSEVNPN